jgi:Tol biopolymer transport system component
MRRLLHACTLAALLVAGSTAADPPSAQAAATCSLRQLTHTTGGSGSNVAPSISANGRYVAFSSDRDLNGTNADLNHEIFRYDTTAHSVAQLSATVGGIYANADPRIDADGDTVAFLSNRNIGGQNMDNNREVFRWVGGTTPTIAPITTSAAPVENGDLTVDDSGSRIVYSSNSDGNYDLYERFTGDPAPTFVTSTTGELNDHAEISGNGRWLVFRSTADFGGQNPDGSTEVYRRDLLTGATLALTRGPGTLGAFSPAVSDDGRRTAFASSFDLAGQNPDHSNELYLRDVPARTSPALTRRTVGGVSEVRINAAGSRVAFVSTADLVGRNDDGSPEVYLRDFGGPVARTTQILPTNNTSTTSSVDIDRAGRRVVFASTGNPLGENGDGNSEIYLADCGTPPVPLRCDGQVVTVDRARGEQPTPGNDVIRGTNAIDAVNGGKGADRFCGVGGNDTFNGGLGNDRAFGDAGNDRLRGDTGDDRLSGGPGDDALTGGPGPDTCDGGPGLDVAGTCTTRFGLP